MRNFRELESSSQIIKDIQNPQKRIASLIKYNKS